MNYEKRLLNLTEFCTYMNIGKTKARELLKENHGFSIKIGNKWLVDKHKLDKWIDANVI